MNEPYMQSADGQRPLEEHLKSRSTWLRLFFMIVVSVFYAVARLVTTIVVVAQFCHVPIGLIGVDRSASVLAIARRRLVGCPALLLRQDIRALSLPVCFIVSHSSRISPR